ncbi:MAG: putative glycosyltransferase [Proteobacteria bacterium]|nr:putative glycosyltransferase [Pseudomonadota bacterium]
MAKRILLLTQWCEPEPTLKGLVFARELVNQGFDVEIVTGFPNYPGGKIYPGYRIKLVQKEVVDGVRITRLPLYPSHNRSALGRVINYASFASASLVYGLFFARRPNLIYAYHPPLTVGLAASLIRFIRRVPVVYDIQDMWPDTLRATGMFSNEKALRVVSSVCDYVYRQMDKIVVLSPGFKKLLIQRGVPQEKIEVIYNWCVEDAISGGAVKATPAGFPVGKFTVLFAGNMGRAQALTSVLEAAQLLMNKARNVSFVFLGGGLEVEHLKNIASEKKIENVVFLPPVPMSEVGAYLAAADALLVHLRKEPLFRITIPSKTQAYMAAGKPIIMAVDGDAADLVKEAGCGFIAESENPQDIANSVLRMIALDDSERELMAENSRRFYSDRLSLKAGVSRFSALFKSQNDKF